MVNGSVCKNSSEHFSSQDSISLNGVLKNYQRNVYIMMNKPEGVISASKDGKSKTALDLLPPDLYRKDLFIAGRLDKNTTGFLLITNDGEFAHNILSPKKHIFKTYLVRLQKPLNGSEIDLFAKGITIGKLQCKPAILEVRGENEARITICEGKFHQIKRMFHAVDNEVVSLHREKMGGLFLDKKLLPGQARYITDDELKLLKDGEKSYE